MNQIEQYGISLYPLPDCDEDEDEDYREQCRLLKVSQCIHALLPVLLAQYHQSSDLGLSIIPIFNNFPWDPARGSQWRSHSIT